MGKYMNGIKRRIYAARHIYLDNFIFIHINKTGGSSIEKALNIPFEHLTALEKIEQIGQADWDRKFTFAVVRNPWDKVVSHYHYRIQRDQTKLNMSNVSFEKWVHLSYGAQDPKYYNNPRMFQAQLDWISNEDGEIIVDKIIRFESLHKGFSEICATIGKNAELPHLKASKHHNYRDYYSEETKKIVEIWFQEDIDEFGYSFK